MSCISEILKVKGDKEFLPLNGIVIEDGGVYKGYEYLITFVELMAHRCGYVAIPENNKLYDKDLMDAEYLNVHGGITFHETGSHIIEEVIDKKISCTDKWIGFDAMHYKDLSDVECYKKYFNANSNRIEYMKESSKLLQFHDYTIKTKEFMIDQCKSLIDQIIELNN